MSTSRNGSGVSRRTFVAGAPLGLAATQLALGRAGEARAAGPLSGGRRLDAGWEHYRGTLGGVWEVWRGDKASDNVPWQAVTVPHCVNARDAVDPDQPYYQGPAWYRTRTKHSNPFPGGRTLLHFEGAGQRTEVHVYLDKVAEHVGGYDEFTVDITDALARAEQRGQPRGEILLAILCDNSRDLERIPSALSDFVLYGGLYRHVNLVSVPAVALERVHVSSRLGATGPAQVAVAVRLSSHAPVGEQLEIEVELASPSGKLVHRQTSKLPAFADSRTVAGCEVKEPERWSPDSPALYRCTVTLRSKHGQHVQSEAFGLRHVEWKSKGPFVLNGQRLLLSLLADRAGPAGATQTVEARLVDGQGVMCLDARNPVRFDLAGEGRLLDNLGTSSGARLVQLYNGRARISLARAAGQAVVSVSSEGLPAAFLTLKATGKPRPA